MIMNNIRLLMACFGISLIVFLSGMIVYHYTTKQKIAYVDSMRLYNDYAGKKEFEKKYEFQRQRKQAYLDSLFIDLQQLEKKMDEQGSSSIQVAENYSNKKKIFEQLAENFEKENKEIEGKYLDAIWQSLNQYINEYAKENRFDYVLGATGSGSLMYADEDNNVTKQVTEYANRKYAGK